MKIVRIVTSREVEEADIIPFIGHLADIYGDRRMAILIEQGVIEFDDANVHTLIEVKEKMV